MSKVTDIDTQRDKRKIREMLGVPDLELTLTEDRLCDDAGHRIRKGKCIYCRQTTMEILNG